MSSVICKTCKIAVYLLLKMKTGGVVGKTQREYVTMAGRIEDGPLMIPAVAEADFCWLLMMLTVT